MRNASARIDEIAARIARAESRSATGRPCFVGEVVDGGEMPSGPEKYYLLRPVSVTGSEEEGDPATLTPSDDPSPVVVMGDTPAVGERLVAHFVAHRWVASKAASTGLCPLCAMEFKEHLKLTFTFSSGEYAYHGYVPKGATGVGDARRHFWRFQPNELDGSSSNFQFYPDFYLNPSFDLWCGKDRTWLEIRAARSDPSFPHDPIVRLDPVVDLDESHVVSCSPLHIVWSGSASFNRPVPDLGDLVGFEAEEYIPPPPDPDDL